MNTATKSRRPFLRKTGAALVPLGGTASVYSDALWNAVEAEERLAVADDGAELPVLPSTLGVASEAQEVDANRILDCAIDSVYQLSADAMDADLQAAMIGGALFETSFSYRGGSSYDPLFLLHNEHGFFALVGRETRFSFLEHEVPASDDSADELDDELDFSMT